MPESKPHSRADLIDNARGLAGLGLDKGYDELLYALSDEMERLEEQFEVLEGRIEAAQRELARASDVRANRTQIIGNVDLILQGQEGTSGS